MINYFPIKPIYITLLVLFLYFSLLGNWLACLLLAFALFNLCWRYQLAKIILTCSCLACFTGYFVLINYQTAQKDNQAPNELTTVTMQADTIKVNGDLLSFRAESDGYVYQAYYTCQSVEEQAYFKQLDQTLTLSIEGATEKATGQRNFGGFNYASYLKHEGVYRILQIDRIKSVEKTKHLGVVNRLRDWRRRLIVYVQKRFPSPMSHYMTGLLFGYLDQSFEDMGSLYSRLGIIHLFALSGMQVGFFVTLFRYLPLRWGVRRDYVNWLQVPFSFLYAGITGFSISVIRSLIQATLGNVGIKGMDNIAVTALLLFIMRPHFLLTTGGVLSFAYAFSLALLDYSDFSALKRLLLESLSLAVGILPLLLYFFASFQPFSILLTAIFSFAFDRVMLPVLTIAMLLSPFFSFSGLNPVFILFENMISWTGQLVGQPLHLGQPTLVCLVLCLMLLGIAYDAVAHRNRFFLLCLPIVGLFCLMKHPLTNEVTIVDVGQGDSILLRDMKGKTILIDVGGRVNFSETENWRQRQTSSNAEKTLIPYLRSRGISHIHQLVLTHTDTDHVGDLQAVAEVFAIDEILISQGSLTQPDFVATLERLGTKIRVVTAGDKLSIMGSYLQVLYPSKQGDGGNNDSIVLYGNLLDKRFLFTGDLEEAGEKELCQTYPNLQVDILKAGHHGSKGSSSSELLSQLGAKIALISAGENNRYQHPHQETLDRFTDEGMTVYRTDKQGAIRFKGWNNWQIETVR